MVEPGDPPKARERPDLAEVGGLCAIAAVAVGLGGVLLAVAVSPWFSWTDDALSDLGRPEHPSALIFNFALIITGALYLEFVSAMWSRAMPGALPVRVALAMLAGGALFLAGVGIFPTGVSPLHFWISVGYFFLYPPGIILLGVAARGTKRNFMQLSVALAGIALLFGILQFTPVFSSQAIPELVLSTALGVWTAVAGWWLRAHAFARPSPAS